MISSDRVDGLLGRGAQMLSNHAVGSRIGADTARSARRLLGTLGVDPNVVVNIAGHEIVMPISHELPHYRKKHPSYSENVGLIAASVYEGGGRTMIDIGANVGDTAAIVKAYASNMAILCIDGDEQYTYLLNQNTNRWPDVTVVSPVLLSDEVGAGRGGIVSVGGTSRVDVSGSKASNFTTLDSVLERHPSFIEADLLKSDTDGFEARILRGASGLLAARSPDLFIEFDPVLLSAAGSNARELLAWLEDLGYSKFIAYDNLGTVMTFALDDLAGAFQLHDYLLEPGSRIAYLDLLLTSDGSQTIERLTDS